MHARTPQASPFSRKATILAGAVALGGLSLLGVPARAQTLSAGNRQPIENVCTGRPGDPANCFHPSPQGNAPLEAQMFDLINRDRIDPSTDEETRGQARLLVWDARLAAVARAHSEEMAREGFFAHQGADGSLPSDRVSRAGVRWLSVGENIAKARDVVQARVLFMDEPKFEHNHRANILDKGFTHVGVGIVKGPDGLLYVTEEFARLP
jgi:uncharacterized protein YkwD